MVSTLRWPEFPPESPAPLSSLSKFGHRLSTTIFDPLEKMINVFNSPIEASTIEDFAEGREGEQIFERRKPRPKIEYRPDGRKMIDGVVEDEQTPNALWATTISRGVANDWKTRAMEGPFYRARQYVTNIGGEVKQLVQQSVRTHMTVILIIVNFLLGITLFRLFKLF